MRKISLAKILFFPVIAAFVTTLSIVLIEGVFQSDIMPPSTAQQIMLSVLLYLGIYFFTIIIVVPVEIYLTNRLKNRLLSFVLINVIGFILIGCMDRWFFTLYSLKSLYLVFPLFSILSLLRFNADAK